MSRYAEQNPDVVVYEPPEPHECIGEGTFTPDMRVGSIILCDCGRYWHRIVCGEYWNRSTDEWGLPFWRPVRWWDFGARRRIREAREVKP
jgi:hypothetical protein